mmetsp:Transcript_88716/g.198366  ORF Transcript_88716/g.198366 Transcript_88716/m.198366 type:complete len:242 (+) Transcript_88716:105-830(+)
MSAVVERGGAVGPRPGHHIRVSHGCECEHVGACAPRPHEEGTTSERRVKWEEVFHASPVRVRLAEERRPTLQVRYLDVLLDPREEGDLRPWWNEDVLKAHEVDHCLPRSLVFLRDLRERNGLRSHVPAEAEEVDEWAHHLRGVVEEEVTLRITVECVVMTPAEHAGKHGVLELKQQRAFHLHNLLAPEIESYDVVLPCSELHHGLLLILQLPAFALDPILTAGYLLILLLQSGLCILLVFG